MKNKKKKKKRKNSEEERYLLIETRTGPEIRITGYFALIRRGMPVGPRFKVTHINPLPYRALITFPRGSPVHTAAIPTVPLPPCIVRV